MLRNQHIIVLTQQGAGRTLELTFTFVNEFSIESSIEAMTQTATITLPRKLYARDQNNKLYSLYSKDFNIGGFNNDNPLIKRGDKIQIYAGYIFQNAEGEVVNSTGLWFDGFVTGIGAEKPFVIECEDYMRVLKQTSAVSKVWKGYTVTSMLNELLQDTEITLNSTADIGITYDVGYFTTDNMTIAQVLEKLRKDAGLYSYMRGTELRVGYPLYIESEAVTHKFQFTRNIIDSDLEYRRKEDVVLSAVGKCQATENAGTAKDGKQKTKKVRRTVFVYPKDGVLTGEDYTGRNIPTNLEGERRTFNYSPNTPVNVMIDDAKNRLQEYYYTGFRGNFVTFGYPYVKHGDNVALSNPQLVEVNDSYKVKAVTYTGGINGLRQTIELDYKTT